jgi:hypothetical protein
MAFGDGSFRSRAASLLRPATPSRGTDQEKASGSGMSTLTERPLSGKTTTTAAQSDPEKSHSLSSVEDPYNSSFGNVVAHDRDAQRIVRTIPGENRSETPSTTPFITGGDALNIC